MQIPRARYLAIALAVLCAQCVMSLAAGPASADEPKIFTSTSAKIAVSGYDPVGYFVEKKPVKGLPAIQTNYQGATWYFASQANKAKFLANPKKYAPQYGGYCAYAVSQGSTASTDPEAWTIVDGKLYLNYSTFIRALWAQDTGGNISKANTNWPRVLHQ